MRREPALLIGVVSAVLSLLVSFGLDFLTAQQAALIVALITAIGGAVTAVITRPVAPSAFTAVVVAAAALVAAYGFDVSQETVGAINGVFLAALVLITREQVSPAMPPATANGGGTRLAPPGQRG